MARKNVKGRTEGDGRFVALHHYMIKSPAWRSLTPQDRAVFVELATVYDGKNNGYLALSTRDAADRCNISKNTATGCFRRLQERGFIELAQRGAFIGAALAAEWRMAHQKCDRTGHMASKAFLRWRPEEKTRSQMRDASVPIEGHRRPKNPPSVPNGMTDSAHLSGPSVPNGMTHIHLAIGTAPDGPACCISDDAREARPPKGAVAGGRRRGSRPTPFPTKTLEEAG